MYGLRLNLSLDICFSYFRRQRHCVCGRPSVCPLIPYKVSVLSGRILTKLATNIFSVRVRIAEKVFQVRGQRSKVKVMTRPINLQCQRHTCQRCGVETSLFLPRCMQCRRGLAMRILSVRLSVRPSVRHTRKL